MMVTTRNRDIGENLGEGEACIEVGPFPVKNAQALLRSKARRPIDGSDDGTTQTLVEVLGRIPLAISQAAAYMNRNSMDVRKYLTALKRDQQSLIDHLECGAPRSSTGTWISQFCFSDVEIIIRTDTKTRASYS
jgi:hypothetical protein